MSETALPQPTNTNPTAHGTVPLWQPVLLRALATLAFGLITVFWGAPGALGLCVLFAAYFLVVAAAQYLVLRTFALPLRDTRRLVVLGASALLAVSGVVVAVSVSAVVAAWLGGAALAVMGAAELFAALHKPAGSAGAKSTLRSDWMISGFLGLGTGILLPFFATVGAHALMGVAGGGALLGGALWTLSALTLRHDSAKEKAA